MASDEDAWRTLGRKPGSGRDMRQAADAAMSLLPPTVTLRPLGTAVAFHFEEDRYWEDAPGLGDDDEGGAPLRYCLTGYGAGLRPRQRHPRRPVRAGVPPLLHALRVEWNGPEHGVTRALLAVHHAARVWLRRRLRGQRMPDDLPDLSARLCHLAAARLDGAAGTIASELAPSWTGTPAELTRTAELIAMPVPITVARGVPAASAPSTRAEEATPAGT